MLEKFFHVSRTDFGEKFKFKPRIPSSAVMSVEGDIPRVCVSTTVLDCINAINGCGNTSVSDLLINCCDHIEQAMGLAVIFKSPAVYMTTRVPYLPPEASDFRDNDERWFITPVTMKRVGFIDLSEIVYNQTIVITAEQNYFDRVDLEDYDTEKLIGER